MPFEPELAVAEEAARRAGAIILGHYGAASTEFSRKADGSPVSRADLEANAAILAIVRRAFPADGLLSEESPDEAVRLARERVWIIDPLDGTRGFLARTDDFGVHVALVVRGIPTVAVVYQPVGDRLDRAVLGSGAFRVRAGRAVRLEVSQEAHLGALRVGVSRHNAPPPLLAWLETHGLAPRAVRLGASGKAMSVADGTLDAVVTITGSEKEWDTCAPELVVREAGGRVTDGDGRTLTYNQPASAIDRPRGILISNGRCHDELLQLMAPLLPEGPR